MATGCVIIGSNTAPVQEVIVDRENGLLVDFFDRAALVDRVDEVLSNPAAFMEMREAARRTVDEPIRSAVCLSSATARAGRQPDQKQVTRRAGVDLKRAMTSCDMGPVMLEPRGLVKSGSVRQWLDARMSGWRVLAIMTACSFVLLVPNLVLFSTDDLDIYRKSGEAGVAISQAGVGRYTFDAIGRICRLVGLDYTSYLVISTVLFSYALAHVYYIAALVVSSENPDGFIFGYVVFLTFGLNLDLFQYVFAYMQYAVAFMSVRCRIWMTHKRRAVSSVAIRPVISCSGGRLPTIRAIPGHDLAGLCTVLSCSNGEPFRSVFAEPSG